MFTNREIHLVARPLGMPSESDFNINLSQIGDPGKFEILLKTLYISVDPYLRGRMKDSSSSFKLNGIVNSTGLAVVKKSNDERFVEGDVVIGQLDWAEYSIGKGDHFKKVNTYGIPVTSALGVLGLTGLTAYFGIQEIGKPREGETFVVSAAGGAVGSIAGQIAQIRGCEVIGIAGSDQKIDYLLKELHFDGAVNYKKSGLHNHLKEKCSKGVDIYFDNVGGPVTDEVLKFLNYASRIVVCGQISSYNLEKEDIGPRQFPVLLMNGALAQGFMVRNYAAHFEQAKAELARWVRDGVLKYKETITDGLENIPKAFIGLFKGENIGKQLVKVSSL
jgi:NADPH-dependent curcumin reductase CurA